MRRLFKTTFLVFMLSAFAINVQAQRMNNGNMKKQQNTQGKMLQKDNQNQRGAGPELRIPDLTEEQKTQIHQIRTSGQKAALPVKNQLREKKAKLITLTTADKYDSKAVNAVVDDISKLEKTMMLFQIEHKQQIRSLLTEEQRLVFDSTAGGRQNNKMGQRGRSNKPSNRR
tara:strand:+ start:20071 stop:20583 length:513 start_codon:yes stop_codon:yes gene_type:complete